MTIPFVGSSIKTAEDKNQYPFGYIFGTSSYTGSYSANQYYYSSISSTTYDNYKIPSSLKKVIITGGNILRGAFEECTNIAEITVPNDITGIGKEAFYNCSLLTCINIPESIKNIGSYAFYNLSLIHI